MRTSSRLDAVASDHHRHLHAGPARGCGTAPSIVAPVACGACPPGSGPPEILVVDNAPSDDRTRDLADRWPEVRYVREPRPGLNFARNRALREARGEILAFLDDDVIADRHWLAGLADAWAANRDAAAFTGQVLPMELETEAQIVFEQRGGFRRGFDRIRYGPVFARQPVVSGRRGQLRRRREHGVQAPRCSDSWAASTRRWTPVRPVPGGGDLDVFYRIIRAGHALVYEPRFLVFHQHRREMAALGRQYRRSWGLGFMCYLTKCIKTDPERRILLHSPRSSGGSDHHVARPAGTAEEQRTRRPQSSAVHAGWRALGRRRRSARRLPAIATAGCRRSGSNSHERGSGCADARGRDLHLQQCGRCWMMCSRHWLRQEPPRERSLELPGGGQQLHRPYAGRLCDKHVIAGAIPGLRSVQEPEQGLTPARLRGVRSSTAPWIAFVDDDCVLRADWIARAWRSPNAIHRSVRSADGWSSTGPSSRLRTFGPSAMRSPSRTTVITEKRVSFLAGAGLVVSRSALSACGWIDGPLLADRVGRSLVSGGDVEIVLRIAGAGYELWYVPAVRAPPQDPARGGPRCDISSPSTAALGVSQALADALVLGRIERQVARCLRSEAGEEYRKPRLGSVCSGATKEGGRRKSSSRRASSSGRSWVSCGFSECRGPAGAALMGRARPVRRGEHPAPTKAA